MNAESIRIERREIVPGRPFSEVFIVADGRSYYTRLWYVVEDSPYARSAQREEFARRQSR